MRYHLSGTKAGIGSARRERYETRPLIEAQAVRTTLGTFSLALLLALAGCQTSKLGKGTPKPGGGSPEFVGVPEAPKEADGPGGSAATTASAPRPKKGTLAGSVQDAYNRLKPGATIHLIELGTKDKKAPLQVLANKAGCFEVPNLVYGKRYELRAEVQDGNRLLTGSTTAVVPSTRVAIYLLQEEAAPAGRGAGAPPPAAPTSDEPMATIGTPSPKDNDRTPADAGPATTPSSATPPPSNTEVPPRVTTGDPSLLAESKPKDRTGDLPAVPPPVVTIPGPGRSHTPEKPRTPSYTPPKAPAGVTDRELQPSTAPSAKPGQEASGPSPDQPPAMVAVPSCVRIGNTVKSFALYDKDGQAREYRAPFQTKLILLDFWFGDCRPCREVIGKLNDWHKKYKGHSLEIVGVSCEPYTTTLAEKKAALKKAIAKHNLRIDYTELLSGGGKGDCPLVKQMLDGEGFPTLILLDQSGKVLYKVSGSNPTGLNRLEWVIYNKLFPATANRGR